MPLEDIKHLLSNLRQHYDVLEKQNISLQERAHRQKKRQERLLDENKQQIVQAETVNMMTKY